MIIFENLLYFSFKLRPYSLRFQFPMKISFLSVLEKEDKEVRVDDGVRAGALKPLERMLELAK